MKRLAGQEPLRLEGFNNLTKSLNFNLYDFCAARNEDERQSYIKYIYERFNAERITGILKGVCNIIDAKVLAVSDQDYDPWGASSLVLMSDLRGGGALPVFGCPGSNMHLDKSHICAHTYPDFREGGKVCTFRIDINMSTCGEISPLSALNYMFENIESDVVVIDYVVRGFTRDSEGKRVFMDHSVRSIQEYIDEKILGDYYCVDLSLQSENIWQTKMLRTKQDIPTYFVANADVDNECAKKYMSMINREMRGILQMWPD